MIDLRRTRLGLLALLTVLAPMALSLAIPGALLAQGEVDQSLWIQQLEAGRSRLLAARAAVEQTDEAYSKGKQRQRLRGEPRAEIVSEREAAARELAAAEEAWPRLLEQARQAGIPPGVLRSFEDSVAR